MCAPSTTNVTASRKSVTTSAIALFTGFGCSTTVSADTTSNVASTTNASVGTSAHRHDHDRGHDDVREGQRQQLLPAEVHQLIVPVPRQAPPHEDLERAQHEHFHREAQHLEDHDEQVRHADPE